jgi:putative membrane protein
MNAAQQQALCDNTARALGAPDRQGSITVDAAALMAFLHQLAACTVGAALAVEVALFRPPLSLAQARRLQRTDLIFGAAAVLVIGLLRVTYFEKGPAYYWHDSYLLLKFTAFIFASLILIYPTVTWATPRSSLASARAVCV